MKYGMKMIKNVLDAYIEKDATKADDVRAKDEDVDHIHSGLYRELLTYMLEDPKNISLCTHLLFVSKNVERMGDHVTSIAEHVHFIVHGKIPEESFLWRYNSCPWRFRTDLTTTLTLTKATVQMPEQIPLVKPPG